MDTIWMITHQVETETGNGSYFDDFIADDLGYFISDEAAQIKLKLLQLDEAKSHQEYWKSGTHATWQRRKEQCELVRVQNLTLGAAGHPLLPVPHLYPEPVYGGWHEAMSQYAVVEIKPGELS